MVCAGSDYASIYTTSISNKDFLEVAGWLCTRIVDRVADDSRRAVQMVLACCDHAIVAATLYAYKELGFLLLSRMAAIGFGWRTSCRRGRLRLGTWRGRWLLARTVVGPKKSGENGSCENANKR